MSLEQIDAQIALIFASYGINWNPENATMLDSFLSTKNFIEIWASFREDAKAALEYLVIKQYYGWDTSYDMHLICTEIVEPGIDQLLSEAKPEDSCERTYTYVFLDALALAQQLGCIWLNRPIEDRVEEIMNYCACFTFGSPLKVNLVNINAVGAGVSLNLYGNGTFSASSNEGSTSGSWSYNGVDIILYPAQDVRELYEARLGLMRNKVCENDTMTLITSAWVDEWDDYHPPQTFVLTVTDVTVTHF